MSQVPSRRGGPPPGGPAAPAAAPPPAPRGPPAHGRAVVSGGAYGIDVAAHRGALAAEGPTVAVLASGVDRSYPAAHGGLLDHVANCGLLVSEGAPGCAPTRSRFLVRNRLIAAL